MKAYFISLVISFSLLVSLKVSAENEHWINFAIDQARVGGLVGCNDEIRDAFRYAGGKDIRISVKWFEETRGEAVRLISAYHDDHDSLMIDAHFRKSGGKCYSSTSTVITTPKSCKKYADDNNKFQLSTEAGDYLIMTNAGGIALYLKPVNGGCVATFMKD